MNKKVTYIVLSLLLVSLAVVSAEETIEIDASTYSIWDNFIHSLQNLGLFTAAGQSRECSSSADYTVTGINGYVPKSSLLVGAGCNVALFNVFDKEWHFINEYRSEDIGGFQIAAASTITNYPAIIEVYCCPYEACDSDSDCDSYPASLYGDFCNTNYGSCYGDAPSYVTQMFQCQNDQWMQYGTASYGEDHFCNEGLNNYIDRNGAEHCVLSSYSSVNDGTWCGSTSTDECSSGETDCSGDSYLTCSNGNWVNNGQTDGECGYTTPVTNNTLPDDAILSAVIYDIQLFKTTFNQGEEVDVRFRVRNDGDAGGYLIETGIIPKSVAEDWGFNYAGQESFTIFDWLTQINTECCNGQPNIFAKTAYFSEGEVSEFSIIIPSAPYSEISDLCYDNNYWDGEGEYVLYITVKTGCYPGGEEVTYETILIDINDTDSVVNVITKTLTWTDFYSITDKKFSEGNYICSATDECPTKEGYTVTCGKDEIFRDRYYNYFLGTCDEAFSWWDGLVNQLITGIPGLANVDICALNSISFWESNWEESGGTCIAESDTWYGQVWDGSLKVMGGMGLPFQYVMIITVMLLITSAGLAIRRITG